MGLSPPTTYHYRVAATNCHRCARGTSYGADGTFTVPGYQNPVYAADAPDPYVLDNGDAHHDYRAFTTGNLFPLLRSSDLVHWTSVGTAMSDRPAWVLQSGDWHPWAPNVAAVSQPCPGTSSTSCYVMYYVGLSARTHANCVAIATATSPGGPYVDQGPLSGDALDASGRPVGCGDDHGYGVIDPSLFVDPGDHQPYLYVSEDFACAPTSSSCTSANSVLKPTISVIPLTSDYMHAAGPRKALFSGDGRTWEATDVAAPTVEGPAAMVHGGTYYLLYSGGNWRSAYGMGYATAPSPTGPFAKAPTNPTLSPTSAVLSPGGGDALVTGPHGGSWLMYHGRAGSYSNPRTLRVDPFSWRAAAPAPDTPVIGGPTSTPQGNQP
jgi:beta-xylosidase